MSNEVDHCPDCNCKTENHSWVRRLIRFPGGESEWRLVEIRRCPECGRCDRLLPDDQVPYKHYSCETIRQVIDDDFTEAERRETEDYPCERTMERWKGWWERLKVGAEGQMRSAAYQILGLSVEFLAALVSLLEEIKKRLRDGWLPVILKIIINSGGLGILPKPDPP